MRLDATASVTQTLPSRSTSMPCGQMNMPPPKLFTTLPSGPNCTIGSVFESRHSSPNRARSSRRSHRTTAQMCRPSGSIATLPAAPIGLPFGSLAQPSTMRYGFGNPCAPTLRGTPDDVMRANANRIPACCGFCMFCTSLAGSGDYTPGHIHRVVVRHWGPHGPEHRRHRRKRPFRSPGPQGGEVRRAHVGRARTRRHDRRSRAVEPAAARSDVQGVPQGRGAGAARDPRDVTDRPTRSSS